MDTILEHDIKLHPVVNRYLEQNIKKGERGGEAVYPSNINYLRTSERLQLSHPGNAQTKERTGVSISYTSVSFIQLSRS